MLNYRHFMQMPWQQQNQHLSQEFLIAILQKDFYTVCRPHRHTTTKEICIFRPNWATQQ
jgi:hypothetical protein